MWARFIMIQRETLPRMAPLCCLATVCSMVEQSVAECLALRRQVTLVEGNRDWFNNVTASCALAAQWGTHSSRLYSLWSPHVVSSRLGELAAPLTFSKSGPPFFPHALCSGSGEELVNRVKLMQSEWLAHQGEEESQVGGWGLTTGVRLPHLPSGPLSPATCFTILAARPFKTAVISMSIFAQPHAAAAPPDPAHDCGADDPRGARDPGSSLQVSQAIA